MNLWQWVSLIRSCIIVILIKPRMKMSNFWSSTYTVSTNYVCKERRYLRLTSRHMSSPPKPSAGTPEKFLTRVFGMSTREVSVRIETNSILVCLPVVISKMRLFVRVLGWMSWVSWWFGLWCFTPASSCDVGGIRHQSLEKNKGRYGNGNGRLNAA